MARAAAILSLPAALFSRSTHGLSDMMATSLEHQTSEAKKKLGSNTHRSLFFSVLLLLRCSSSSFNLLLTATAKIDHVVNEKWGPGLIMWAQNKWTSTQNLHRFNGVNEDISIIHLQQRVDQQVKGGSCQNFLFHFSGWHKELLTSSCLNSA